jgi:hypothetical protein
MIIPIPVLATNAASDNRISLSHPAVSDPFDFRPIDSNPLLSLLPISHTAIE